MLWQSSIRPDFVYPVWAQTAPNAQNGQGEQGDIKQINIAASLFSTDSRIIANGEYEVRFAIYSTDRTTPDPYPSSNDAPLWEETQTVEVSNGVFRAWLGAEVPLPDSVRFNEGQYYLGIRIGTDSEMVPRKSLASVPSAVNAQFLDGRSVGTEAGNIAFYDDDGVIALENLPEETSFLGETIELEDEVDGVLQIENGGTGLDTTPGNGQILIGNGSEYVLGTLSGASITSDSLNFTEFADLLTVDATTDIALASGIDLTTSGSGAISFGNTGLFTVAGATTIQNTLNVTGATTLGSTLTVGTAGDFAVAADGDITKIKGLDYTWPTAHLANTALTNDGNGNLTWATIGSIAVTNDSLDFADFLDAMTLDASTDISITDSNVLSLTNTGTGDSFLVNDQASDTTPFVINASGQVGIGITAPTAMLDVRGTVELGPNADWSINSSGHLIWYNRQLSIGWADDNTLGSYIKVAGSSNENIDIGSRSDGYVAFNEVSAGTSGNNQQVRFYGYQSQTGDTGSAYGYIQLVNPGASSANYLLLDTQDSDQNIVLQAANGNVGIGDTSPAALFTVGTSDAFQVDASGNITTAGNLDVNGITNDIAGTLNLSGNALTSSGALTVTPASGSNLNISLASTGDLAVNTDDLYVDTSTGRVGIGTTTPAQELEVVNTAGDTGTSIAIYNDISDTANNGSETANVVFYLQAQSDGKRQAGLIRVGKSQEWTSSNASQDSYMSFSVTQDQSTTVEAIRILNTGNVGIGDTTPAAHLVVGSDAGAGVANGTGDAYIQNDLEVDGTIYGAGLNISGTTTLTGNLLPGADDTYDLGSSSFRWRDLYLGPTSLHIYCSAAECTSARDWAFGVQETDGTDEGNLRFTLGGSDLVNITPSGNFGIGTTTPSGKFEISGSAADVVTTLTAADATYDPVMKFRTGASPAVAFTLGVDNDDSDKFKIFAGDGLSGEHFSIDTSGVTSIANLELGAQTFETDAGSVTWVDMPVTASATDGTVEAYTAMLDGNPMLTIYGLSDGAGSVDTLGIGIMNTAPTAALDVTGDIKASTTITSATGFLAPENTANVYSFTGATTSGFGRENSNLSFVLANARNLAVSATAVKVASGINFGFTATSNAVTGAIDTILARDAAGILAQRNSTSAQEFRIYNTDGASDDEFVSMGFQNNSNVFTIETEETGSGTIRNIALMGGSVGIGTTGPDRKLDVLDASNPQMRLSHTDGSVYADFQVDSNGDLIMGVDGTTNQFVLDNSGNVGIGTAAPGEELTVSKDQDSATYLQVTNSNSGGTSALAGARFFASTAEVYALAHGAGRTVTRYGVTVANYGELLVSTGSGLLVGTGTNASPIIFGTNSLERMRIGSDGYVGIGTTSAASLFEVSGSGADVVATLTASDATYDPVLKLRTGTSPAVRFSLGVDQSDSNRFKITPGDGLSGDAFAIDSTGVTTISNLQLGAQSFETDAGMVTWIDMPVTAASADNTVMRYTAMLDGNPILTIYGLSDGAGGVDTTRVGIGTATPTQKMEIHTGTLSNTYDGLKLTDGTVNGYNLILNNSTVWGTATTGMAIGTGTAHPLILATNGAEVMRITSAGNIGIGQAVPTRNFVVQKDQNSGTIVNVRNDTSGTSAYAGFYASSGDLSQYAALAQVNPSFTTSGLLVANSVALFSANNTNGLRVFTYDATNLTLGTNNSANVTIESGGKVGIGVTTPDEMLDVKGDIRIADGTNASILELGGTDYQWDVKRDYADNGKFKIRYVQGTLDALTIDRAGNVGIRTSSPNINGYTGTTLTLYGNTLGNQTALEIHGNRNGATQNVGNVTFLNSQSSASGDRIAGINGNVGNGGDLDSGALSFFTANTSGTFTHAMTIDEAQNVGIGVTSPGGKLDIRDGNFIMSDADVAHGITDQTATTTFFKIAPGHGSAGGALLDGFSDASATSNPMYIRGFFGETDPTDTTAAIVLDGTKRTGTSSTALGSSETVLQVVNGGATSTALMTILGSGNVGIGTTAPKGRLQIGNADWGSPNTTYKHAFFHNVDIMGRDTSTDNYILSNSSFNTSNDWYRVLDGYASAIRMSSGGLGFMVGDTSTAGSTVAFTEAMTVNGDGNVGIGTATPDYALEVTDQDSGTNTVLATLGIARTTSGTAAAGLGQAIQFLLEDDVDALRGAGQFGVRWESAAAAGPAASFFFKDNGGTDLMVIADDGDIQFGTYGAGTLMTDASGNITASSDVRLKDVQGDFDRGLDDIRKIEPIKYRWNVASGLDRSTVYAGFSAQNILTAIPEAIDTDGRGYYTLQDRPIQAALINAVKELDTVNIQQTASIADLNLRTAENITTLAGLQDSVDEQLVVVSGEITALKEKNVVYDEYFTNDRNDIESLFETTEQLASDVNAQSSQIALLEEQMATLVEFYTALDLGGVITRDVDGNVDLQGGKLSIGTLETGGIRVVNADEDAPTIGTVTILPVVNDADEDGIDDETGADGRTATVMTEAMISMENGSRIFTNFKNNPGAFSWVEKIVTEAGEYVGFRVLLSAPVAEAVELDWWLIEEVPSE